MPRPEGLPKTGGRVLGTPNKKTELIAKKLAKLGCDPIEGLARIALDPQTKVEIKVRCFSELAQYVYPKRKAIDVATVEPARALELNLGGLPIPAEVREAAARLEPRRYKLGGESV